MHERDASYDASIGKHLSLTYPHPHPYPYAIKKSQLW